MRIKRSTSAHKSIGIAHLCGPPFLMVIDSDQHLLRCKCVKRFVVTKLRAVLGSLINLWGAADIGEGLTQHHYRRRRSSWPLMILICMGHKVVTWNNNNASAPFLSADVIYSCTAAFFLLALILGKQQVEEFTSKEIQIPPRAKMPGSRQFSKRIFIPSGNLSARLLFSWLREKVDYAGNKITCVHSHPRVAALLKFPRRLLRLSPAASSLAVSPLCNFFSPSRCVFLIWSRGTKSSYARWEHCAEKRYSPRFLRSAFWISARRARLHFSIYSFLYIFSPERRSARVSGIPAKVKKCR